jgi:alkylation response protein AidB-like acyl-CoA dehydrogenase
MTASTTVHAEQLVRERVDELLAKHDPAVAEPQQFWGAQFDLGLAWVQFPEGEGGLGVSPALQEVVNDALARAGAPSNFAYNGIGVGMAAPVIQAFATVEQRQRFLRPIWTCEEIWCQMFSEPGAGSDVAALSTRAVRDGDEWVVNGQKVWTTLAHMSRWGLLLARSDPDAPKHKGLTYFVIDMHQPGVEVRPLRQMTGEAEFNEVYFTDARIPDELRLGAEGDGWRVAIATLMNERTAIGAASAAPRNSGAIGRAVELWQRRARATGDDDALRDRVAQLWVEAEAVRLTTVRAQQQRSTGVPGPEESTGKLAASELAKKVNDLCLDLLGAEGLVISGYEMTRPEAIALTSADNVPKAFLRSRANTIEGGTSEIMRNILGERVLGLPGDVRTDKDLPWSQVPR